MKTKYPRTKHLPWSKGATSDDKILKNVSCFNGKEIVITEKMDGENSTLARDYYHARSLDSKDHPSRSWIKALHSQIAYDIPRGWRICGENLYAKHSVAYDNLKSYFLVFSIWNEHDKCLSWDDTVEFCDLLGLQHVPVIGIQKEFDAESIKSLKIDETKSEGYVIRNATGFHHSEFGENIAKYVRANHVTTDTHWMHSELIKNTIAE